MVDLAETPAGPLATPLAELDQMRLALELGLRDYVEKNGFGDVVVGISGGIDSALTAALAAEALGPDRVHCVSMPSRFSSEATRSDARLVAESLGADFREISDRRAPSPLSRTALAASFAGRERDTAEENLQARVRGTLLMALSNKLGWLVLATGNKSELSVGYATLYGDMAGGFALLKDVYKTDVWRLARHLNERARAGGDPVLDHRARPQRRAAARPARRALAPARTRSSTRCSRRTSSSTARARSSSRRASTPTSWPASCRWSTARSTSAVRRRRA